MAYTKAQFNTTVFNPDGGTLVLETGSTLVLAPASVTAAGSTVSDAAALTGVLNLVGSANGTKGVVLPTTPVAGTVVFVKNNAGSALKVWPDAAATINAIGSNGAISMAANTFAIFLATSTTQWYTLPLLPS